MKKLVLTSVVVCCMCCGCTTVGAQEVSRKSIFNALHNDITVVAQDLEIRATDNALSKYASAVARLEMETARAKDLLRQKAKEENTDLIIYESWIRQADAAHDAKLAELGEEKRLYLERWSQRYLTLQKDAQAIQALKENEKARRDRCMRSGISGFVRTLFGYSDQEATKLDIGSLGSLGTLGSVMLP